VYMMNTKSLNKIRKLNNTIKSKYDSVSKEHETNQQLIQSRESSVIKLDESTCKLEMINKPFREERKVLRENVKIQDENLVRYRTINSSRTRRRNHLRDDVDQFSHVFQAYAPFSELYEKAFGQSKRLTNESDLILDFDQLDVESFLEAFMKEKPKVHKLNSLVFKNVPEKNMILANFLTEPRLLSLKEFGFESKCIHGVLEYYLSGVEAIAIHTSKRVELSKWTITNSKMMNRLVLASKNAKEFCCNNCEYNLDADCDFKYTLNRFPLIKMRQLNPIYTNK